jgi:tetratricopeptide (TPR) repeat protein
VARKIEQGRVSENHQLQKRCFLHLTLYMAMLLLLIACFVGWQAEAGTAGAAQHQDEARALEAGKSVDQQLAGGQAHVYQVTLAAGQYLHVLVEQQGVDVLVKVSGPDGKPLLEVDRPIGSQGQEPVSLVATAAGAYQLEVRATEKAAPAGRYQIRVAELRAATAQDADRISAERAFLEGEKLQAEATADTLAQAIKKYDEALRLWRSVGERQWQADTLYYLGSIYESQGNRQKAIAEYYTPALALARALHDQAKEGDLLTNIGKALDELGEKQKALGYYEQSLALYRTLKSASGEATTLNNIGKVYDDLGQ